MNLKKSRNIGASSSSLDGIGKQGKAAHVLNIPQLSISLQMQYLHVNILRVNIRVCTRVLLNSVFPPHTEGLIDS